ncbi:MAG: hypothetical protein OFPII_30920 [Osedax symbiont Rs1]|nr:MAG: hypothetical protein OFPII_30920 [Osedax symbiont Rs1]
MVSQLVSRSERFSLLVVLGEYFLDECLAILNWLFNMSI